MSIEARAEAATPLTDEEYAVWKGNIEALAEAHAGQWYKREDGEFVPVQTKPAPEITTTVGVQLRLFATIDALLAELKTARETLAAVEEWADYAQMDHNTFEAGQEIDRILKGGA